jgi:hypothetical protein
MLASITFCEPVWNFCGHTPQYITARPVLWALSSVSIVPDDTGKAESVESVESVRYKFGKHGHAGTGGSWVRYVGLASGSKGNDEEPVGSEVR